MTLCKYFKDCYCACSGEADEVGEIDELCTIGKLHARIDRIKKHCQKTLNIMNKDSSKNAYAGGRCIEAENVLKVIEGAEDEYN